jgi:hypothetical protein
VKEGIAAGWMGRPAGNVIRIEPAIIDVFQGQEEGYGVTRLPSRVCESCSIGLARCSSGELLDE